ncbi:hypothetical protein DC434_19920, partial [Microbacterium sp. TPD7012]
RQVVEADHGEILGNAEAAWPSVDLATVRYDIIGMAEAAADLIVRRIENREAPIENVRFASSFVPRRTLAAAAAG